MITEHPEFDLTKLVNNFIECETYTKQVILQELLYWQTQPDFLCLISENNGEMDGFVLGYRNRDSLFVSQMWRKSDGDFNITREGLQMTKDWAKARGMISLTGETRRTEMSAMKRYGWEEFSVIMRLQL